VKIISKIPTMSRNNNSKPSREFVSDVSDTEVEMDNMHGGGHHGQFEKLPKKSQHGNSGYVPIIPTEAVAEEK